MARIAQALLSVAALAYALAVVFVVPRSGGLITTYASSSSLASVLDLMAGLALIGAGVLASRERSGGSLGPLVLLIGIVWFAPDWIGWEDGAPLVRSVGMLVAPFALALVLHLVLAGPRGRLGGRLTRGAVAVVYVVAAVVSAGRALFRDPFEDLDCWSNCTDNVFLVHHERWLADALGPGWLFALLAAGVFIASVAAWRLLRATVPARPTSWPVLAPAALVAAVEAAYAAALLITPAENPHRTGFAALFLVRASSLIGLAGGVVWVVVRARRTRATVAHLSVERQAASPAMPLRETLARALGDPGLEVAYPMPGSSRQIDASGAKVTLSAPGSGRAITRIVRDGEPVAVVGHDATLLDGPALEREIGAAARLAVDNERLQAATLAQLEDLRASRVRIVETGDAARRYLERDLHDGAQQRLLALSYELRLARAAADADPVLESLLATAVDGANAALDDLRELAHGIYPAILSEAGLAAALATLADTAPLPVELDELTRDRLTQAVETAAYLIVAAGIEDAARRGATHVGVSAVRRGEALVVELTDDSGAQHDPMLHLADRVGALGGRLETGPNELRAELPCG